MGDTLGIVTTPATKNESAINNPAMNTPVAGTPENEIGTRRRWLARLIVGLLVVYWLLLFTGTHIPMPNISGGGGKDKVAHFAGYLLLALLACAFMAAHWRLTWKNFAGLFLVLIGYGVIDELLQMPIPGRSADIKDWYADCLGTAAGVALFAICYAWYREK